MTDNRAERIAQTWAEEWDSAHAAIWLVLALAVLIQYAIVQAQHCFLGNCTGAMGNAVLGLKLLGYVGAINVIALPELLVAAIGELRGVGEEVAG